MVTAGQDKESINYSIGFGSKLQVNTLGPDIFGGPGKKGEPSDIVANIDELIQALKDGDANKMLDCGVKIENNLQISVDARADVGARMNRLALTQNRVENSLANLEESLSINDDADYTEAVTKWTSAKSIYQAALSTGSKILQISLLNYL